MILSCTVKTIQFALSIDMEHSLPFCEPKLNQNSISYRWSRYSVCFTSKGCHNSLFHPRGIIDQVEFYTILYHTGCIKKSNRTSAHYYICELLMIFFMIIIITLIFNEDLQIKLQYSLIVSNLVLLNSRNILHYVITILMQLTYFRYIRYTVTDISQTHNIHRYITITQR
jgi:hypothetical protein